jgi:hypothetical protein
VGVPITENLGPFGIEDAFISIRLIEMLMGNIVGGLHDVSCSPDDDNTTEKTNQAQTVENGHKLLTLLSVTLQND